MITRSDFIQGLQEIEKLQTLIEDLLTADQIFERFLAMKYPLDESSNNRYFFGR